MDKGLDTLFCRISPIYEFRDFEATVKNLPLKRFQEASAAWRGQFLNLPDLELVWSVDPSGLLLLNGNWICPASAVKSICVYPMWFDLELNDGGILTIIITREFGCYEIDCIERTIPFQMI